MLAREQASGLPRPFSNAPQTSNPAVANPNAMHPAKPSSPSALDLRVPPLLLWVVSALSILAIARWVPFGLWPIPGQALIGSALILIGALIALAGVWAFAQARTTVNPMAPEAASSIVTVGVYRYTRNPMYLGMAAALLGLALWPPSPAGIGIVALFCAYLSRYQIKPEEAALQRRFGSAYVDYCARVRAWL